MSVEEFAKKMQQFATAAGLTCRCSFNPEISRHKATFSDGTWITGNTSSRRVTINWASGHRAVADF